MASEAATRRWAGYLALPTNAALGLRLAWESADAHLALGGRHRHRREPLHQARAAGRHPDRDAAGPPRQGEAAAEATLDRRIEAVMSFERLKARAGRLELGRFAAGALGRLRYGALRF